MIDSSAYFTPLEQLQVKPLVTQILRALKGEISPFDFRVVRQLITRSINENISRRDKYGINPTIRHLRTALMIIKYIFPDRNMTIATLLYSLCKGDFLSEKQIAEDFGEDVGKMVRGLNKISQLYKKQAAVEDENFQKLLLTFAEDIRVIVIMIVDRLALMKNVINHHPDEKFVTDISSESRYLYAPLAHRLGLYAIKSELEDLSLKYLNRKVYTQISDRLSETKAVRDRYMTDFIKPIREALEKAGLKFEIKGRTKSINSIWNKMKNKDVDLKDIYDLFAIRVILDSPLPDEKKDCWLVYSIVTDIYTANVSRLRDWITIPKSNKYESLHITVRGQDDKWVEVQIRTRRMDELAERGIAAHWKYKGIKSEQDLDQFMNSAREILEAGQKDLIRSMDMNLYDKEVFVFTPRGDVFRLPKGASILDFAFHIHSNLGAKCVGARVDGKNQKLNYKLSSGDTVEILTSSTQSPKLDWLNYVVTSKARNKIKQAVNEARIKKAAMAKEMMMRRLKNRKIDADETSITKFISKMGYKTITDFYVALADEQEDILNIIDKYAEYVEADKNATDTISHESAENFVLRQHDDDEVVDSDILVIDNNNIKGINYKFAKCCNPILGDRIVGFIGSDGAIKVHRADCPNIKHLKARYPYRIIRSQWSGKVGGKFAATLEVIGQDDIGIVANITSVINKSGDTALRSISINSSGGLFRGYLVIGIESIDLLTELIKKIKNLKGVKDVKRMN